MVNHGSRGPSSRSAYVSDDKARAPSSYESTLQLYTHKKTVSTGKRSSVPLADFIKNKLASGYRLNPNAKRVSWFNQAKQEKTRATARDAAELRAIRRQEKYANMTQAEYAEVEKRRAAARARYAKRKANRTAGTSASPVVI